MYRGVDSQVRKVLFFTGPWGLIARESPIRCISAPRYFYLDLLQRYCLLSYCVQVQVQEVSSRSQTIILLTLLLPYLLFWSLSSFVSYNIPYILAVASSVGIFKICSCLLTLVCETGFGCFHLQVIRSQACLENISYVCTKSSESALEVAKWANIAKFY